MLVRRRTYANLAYLVLSLPLALLYAGVLGVGAMVGAFLSIAGIGLLILLGCLTAAWGFAVVERELAITLLGADVPPMTVPGATLPTGLTARLTAHLGRSVTWRSLAFLVLKLPLGMFVATAAGVLLAGAAGLVFLGVSALFGAYGPPSPLAGVLAVWLVLAGIGVLIATLHGLNLVARACGALAVRLLGIGDEERQLWEAQRRAEAAERARQELILNVSHELRTPIASIRGHIDTLLMPDAERPAEATPERYLPIVSAEARRLGSLVEDLLDLSRADAHRLTVAVGQVALDEAVRSAVAAIAPVARRDRGVTVAHERELPALGALADPDRLAQILGNLLRNAVNHTPEGGAVFVQLGAEAGRAWIDVADTGTGIAAADLDRVFERFYRGDASRSRDSGGYGLGLPIARELAEAMGGGLTVTSEVGVGSRFRLTLRQP